MASDSDRLRALKAFDHTKAGVKGLVDAGVTTIPSIFHHPLPIERTDHDQHFTIPVIDLAAATGGTTTTPSKRVELVGAVKAAAETVGFFQVVNHGVPKAAMSEILMAVQGFHEQPREAKAPYYTRDLGRPVRYWSNFDLFQSPAAQWRDTLYMQITPELPQLEEIPPACRPIALEYARLMQLLLPWPSSRRSSPLSLSQLALYIHGSNQQARRRKKERTGTRQELPSARTLLP
ncbi:hypothetical protein VPH35_070900 [Triticum aestivum]